MTEATAFALPRFFGNGLDSGTSVTPFGTRGLPRPRFLGDEDFFDGGLHASASAVVCRGFLAWGMLASWRLELGGRPRLRFRPASESEI